MKSLFFLLTALLSALVAQAQVTGTINTEIFHNTVSTADSKVTYEVALSNGWMPGTSTITSLVLKNDAGTTVYTHATGSSPYGVINNLAAGHYLFTGNVSTLDESRRVVSVYVEKDIWVGNKVYWSNCFDMQQGTGQYTLFRSAAGSGVGYSYAQSFNQLASGSAGWTEMSKLNGNINDSHIYWVLDPISDPRTFSPSGNLNYVEFFYTNSTTYGIRVKYRTTGGTYTTTTLGVTYTDKIRFVRSAAGTCTLQKNNSTGTIFTFPVNITGELKVTVFGKQLNDQADELATSFAYPSSGYPFTTTFNATDNSNTGVLTARISPLSGYASPYNYFVSPVPIADLKDIYRHLKDSVFPGTGVDSSEFFKGYVSAATYATNQIPASTYYTAVFDNTGKRIYSNVYDLAPAVTFSESANLVNSYNEYVSTTDAAYGSMYAYVTEQENAAIRYTIYNTSKVQAFGIVDQNTSVTGGTSAYAKFSYGYYVSGGTMYIIKNGGLLSTPYTAKKNTPLELVFENGVIYFWFDGVMLYSETLPSQYTYKSALNLRSWGAKIVVSHQKLTFRPYAIRTTSALGCEDTGGNLGITFSGFHGASLSSINFTLKNYTDETAITTVQTVTGNTTVSALPAGVYLLEGSMTVGGTSYSNIKQIIYHGSKVSWEPYTEIETWPGGQTNSVKGKSTVTVSNPGKAISTNKLNPATAGWIVLTHQSPSGFLSVPPRWTSVSLSQAPLMPTAGLCDNPNMPFISFYYGIAVACTTTTPLAGGLQFTPIQGYVNNTPLLMNRTASGTVRYRQNYNVLRTVVNYDNLRWKPAVYTNIAGAGTNNVLSSFQCVTGNADLYAQLKYDMDGYYHIMKGGNINFVFDQEYDAANLQFNLYNSNDVLIRTQADFPAMGTTNGKNYLTLVVRNSYCIGAGFFYLEIINSKKEKMYLRFYNDYSGCTIQGEGSGQ